MKCNVIETVVNGDMSANIVSDPISLDQIFGFAVQAVYTGSPVGVIKLQATCDAPNRNLQISDPQAVSLVNWDDIASSSAAVPYANNILTWNVDRVYYRFFRLVYEATSGSGVLNVVTCVKGV